MEGFSALITIHFTNLWFYWWVQTRLLVSRCMVLKNGLDIERVNSLSFNTGLASNSITQERNLTCFPLKYSNNSVLLYCSKTKVEFKVMYSPCTGPQMGS